MSGNLKEERLKMKKDTLVNNKYIKRLINFKAQRGQIDSILKLTQHPVILKSSES